MDIDNRKDLGLRDAKDAAAGCACCATTAPSASRDAAPASVPDGPGAQASEVLVTGMTCSHCVMSVTEELTSIEGVEDVSVELNAGGVSRVTIRSSGPVARSAVQAAVEEAGYSLARSLS